MANESAGAVADKGAAGGEGADAGAGKGADDKSILDGAKAPGKEGEPNGKSSDDAGKAADTSKTGDDKNAAGKDDTSKKDGAPEKYEPFKAPEGMTLDEKAVEGFTALAKEMNLSQASAQKLVDYQTSQIKAAQETNLKNFEQMQKDWASDTRKALGSEADKQLSFAAVARDKFLTEGARKVLNDSGLANHPELIKSLISIGKAISEDSFVEGKGDKGGKGEGKTAAQIIYPNQK